MEMIKESPSKLKNFDDYDSSQKDLLETGAISNALWELKSLKK
jgi:hypothetical protein